MNPLGVLLRLHLITAFYRFSFSTYHKLNYGVTNNMREGNLAATGTRQILIDRSTVLNQQLCRDRAHSGRGGDGKGILHIGSHSFCRTMEGNDLIFYFFHVFRLW